VAATTTVWNSRELRACEVWRRRLAQYISPRICSSVSFAYSHDS